MRGTGWMKTVAVAAACGIALSGCSSANSDTKKDDDKLTVVTSTNVYSDIVKSVAGDDVDVKPVIDSTSQDPHSYEATSQDRLKVKDADLIVENGGGYDAFMDDISKDSKATKIDAVKLSGLPGAEDAAEHHHHDHDEDAASEEHHDHDHGSFNEHVWYNPEVMAKVSHKVAEELGSLDKDHKDDYTQRGDHLADEIDKVKDRAAGLNGEGREYLATEPVPGYLLGDAGLKDATSNDFYEAIEGDTDAPASVIKSMKDQLASGNIAMLGFNSQTESSQTKDIKTYAEEQDVPTVSFTETLPDGENYVDWMNKNLDNVSKALEKKN